MPEAVRNTLARKLTTANQTDSAIAHGKSAYGKCVNGRFAPTRTAGTGRLFKISTADGDIGRWSAIRWLADTGRERPQRQPGWPYFFPRSWAVGFQPSGPTDSAAPGDGNSRTETTAIRGAYPTQMGVLNDPRRGTASYASAVSALHGRILSVNGADERLPERADNSIPADPVLHSNDLQCSSQLASWLSIPFQSRRQLNVGCCLTSGLRVQPMQLAAGLGEIRKKTPHLSERAVPSDAQVCDQVRVFRGPTAAPPLRKNDATSCRQSFSSTTHTAGGRGTLTYP